MVEQYIEKIGTKNHSVFCHDDQFKWAIYRPLPNPKPVKTSCQTTPQAINVCTLYLVDLAVAVFKERAR
ncbi:MAG: hypothetical protein JKX92_11245 [Porticoccaceae bacterium]|nr:hypothetical protein [Porticoccaceae bacterium]